MRTCSCITLTEDIKQLLSCPLVIDKHELCEVIMFNINTLIITLRYTKDSILIKFNIVLIN
jgi:hypothetical protein